MYLTKVSWHGNDERASMITKRCHGNGERSEIILSKVCRFCGRNRKCCQRVVETWLGKRTFLHNAFDTES